jgi:hypothetical protein
VLKDNLGNVLIGEMNEDFSTGIHTNEGGQTWYVVQYDHRPPLQFDFDRYEPLQCREELQMLDVCTVRTVLWEEGLS